jgi:hypothetical protein
MNRSAGLPQEELAMRRITFALVTFLVLALPAATRAEMVRFHFVPVDAAGTMRHVPCGPDGAAGELLQGFGMRRQGYAQIPRATHLVTFRHPIGRHVTVPLALPEGPPSVATRADRIVYSYGTFSVEVHFVNDGSVDVIYNSGFLRPLVMP